MEEKRTTLLENSFIWFGAAVSIAEILTGTYFAPLGFKNGFLAIILGHIIGCCMLFLAGVVGGKVRLSAMDSVKMSFGEKGGILFAILNIMQLLGWTGIMIYDGALSANGLVSAGNWVWALVIGILIVLWVMFGIVNVTKINSVAVTALLVLTVILSVKIFMGEGSAVSSEEAMSFGAAVELSAAMPLSWLPLISDYTSKAEAPVKASAVSAVIYGIVSCWMYTIGMGAAIFTGESDLAQIMIKAGLGAGLVIIIFSTVTTTFLDAYSAGISAESVSAKLKSKAVAVAAAVLGTIGAILFNMDDITDFLYLIGSVFAPMTAVLIADFFILKRRSIEKAFVWTNLVVWVIGFVIYRYLMNVDFILGNTLPDMLITMVICVAANKVVGMKKAAEAKNAETSENKEKKEIIQPAKEEKEMTIYDFTVKDRKGNDVKMSDYKGKVLLIVNTATGCGFTPQYEGLEKLWEEYHGKGLEILDFPCDQFGHQAPGTDEDIHQFCQMKFNTGFENFKKIEVNGENAEPLYKYLKSQKSFAGFTGEKAEFMADFIAKQDPDYKNNSEIKWNFTKFLVNRNGEVVERFESTTEPAEIADKINSLL